jgi:copper chaperone CopZ
VRSALAELPGVKDVAVDFGTKTANCTVDSNQFDGTSAIQALADAGFENSTLN